MIHAGIYINFSSKVKFVNLCLMHGSTAICNHVLYYVYVFVFEGKFHSIMYMYRSKWKGILNLVQCEIITSCHGDSLDAYLLRYVL